MDLIILSISPIPYVDHYITVVANGKTEVTYMLTDFIIAFMFMRLYHLFKTCFNYSIFTDPLSKIVCREYGF